MIEQDTIRLLRECDSGIKIGITSVDEVIDKARNQRLKQCLSEYKKDHEQLKEEMQGLLEDYHDDGKEPPQMAKGMAWVKTNVKMAVENSDATIADLMVDGCNMGVKTLSKYLNQYAAADEKSKDMAKKLIRLEERMSVDMRSFL